jgi:hypothetical protein
MPVPPLPWVYNPVVVKIQQLNPDESFVDDGFDEPIVQREYDDPIEIECQVNRGGTAAEQLRRRWGGDAPYAYGHLVFKPDVIADAGIVLRKGDRVVAIKTHPSLGDFEEVDYEILDVRAESYLRGVPLLIYAVFKYNPDGTETV